MNFGINIEGKGAESVDQVGEIVQKLVDDLTEEGLEVSAAAVYTNDHKTLIEFRHGYDDPKRPAVVDMMEASGEGRSD